MSGENTKVPHDKAVGYIVYCRGGMGGPTTVCHGAKPGSIHLLFGNPVTLFKTRRAADRAIAGAVDAGRFRPNELSIVRVAPLR